MRFQLHICFASCTLQVPHTCLCSFTWPYVLWSHKNKCEEGFSPVWAQRGASSFDLDWKAHSFYLLHGKKCGKLSSAGGEVIKCSEVTILPGALDIGYHELSYKGWCVLRSWGECSFHPADTQPFLTHALPLWTVEWMNCSEFLYLVLFLASAIQFHWFANHM